MDSDSNDILEQYMTISSKLKKRFLRKPNITEACESFISLAKKCESLELPAYSSLCWIAAARCEGSLLNNTGETSCLVQSARELFKAEQSDRDLGCKNLSGEYLQAFIERTPRHNLCSRGLLLLLFAIELWGDLLIFDGTFSFLLLRENLQHYSEWSVSCRQPTSHLLPNKICGCLSIPIFEKIVYFYTGSWSTIQCLLKCKWPIPGYLD